MGVCLFSCLVSDLSAACFFQTGSCNSEHFYCFASEELVYAQSGTEITEIRSNLTPLVILV